MQKGFKILNVANIMNNMKILYQKRMMNLIQKDPEMAENKLVDNNRITELIQISSFFKILRLVVIIFNLTIILASFQHIYYVIVDRAKQQQFENMSE